MKRLSAKLQADRAEFDRRRYENDVLVKAYGYFAGYPMFRSAIGDQLHSDGERSSTLQELNWTHQGATTLLLWEAERLGLDGSPLWTSALVCQRLLEHEPWRYIVGHSEYWPECLGQAFSQLTSEDRLAVMRGDEVLRRLVARADERLKRWRPPSTISPGRPRLDAVTVKEREEIIARCRHAESAGIDHKTFAETEGLQYRQLRAYLSWDSQRRKRKQ